LTDPPDATHPSDPDPGSGSAPRGFPEQPRDQDEAVGRPDRLGLRTFSLEGRRAPGLYLVGWLGTVLGLPIFLAAFLSGVAPSGRLVLIVIGSVVLGLGLIAASGAQALERRDRAELPYRGPSPFLVFAASIPLTILIALPLALSGADANDPWVALISVLMTAAIWLGLIAVTVVGSGALSWQEVAPGVRGAPVGWIAREILVGAVSAVPVVFATAILASFLVGIFGTAPEPPITVPSQGLGIVVALIAAAVIAPISEELFYRGYATTAWARSYGVRRGIVQGALFFAFVHVLTLSGVDFSTAARAALVGFIGRIPIALALGWIFEQRHSLPASIGLHAAFNGILVLVAALVAPRAG